jgi:ATP-dependent Zn protease
MMLSAVSVHEAGHATAAEFLHRPVVLATIRPSRGIAFVHWRDEPAADLPESLRRRMHTRGLVALSGAAAESIFSGLPLRELLAGDDLRKARAAATALAMTLREWAPDSRQRVFARLVADAEALVSNSWDVIIAVAQALETSKTLTGAQVARLIHFANKKGSNK